MSTGIFVGEIIKRALYLGFLGLSFYTINISLILFFILLLIFVSLILLSVYTIVVYEDNSIQIIQNRFLGFNKKRIVLNISDIKSIIYHNYGFDLPSRTFNMFAPAGARVSVKQDVLEVELKTGEKLSIGVNLEGARLEKIINRINSLK